MHVENVAILDAVYNSEAFSDADIASNLEQVVAIGAICNAASFDNSSLLDKKTNERAVSGNATGEFFLS